LILERAGILWARCGFDSSAFAGLDAGPSIPQDDEHRHGTNPGGLDIAVHLGDEFVDLVELDLAAETVKEVQAQLFAVDILVEVITNASTVGRSSTSKVGRTPMLVQASYELSRMWARVT